MLSYNKFLESKEEKQYEEISPVEFDKKYKKRDENIKERINFTNNQIITIFKSISPKDYLMDIVNWRGKILKEKR